MSKRLLFRLPLTLALGLAAFSVQAQEAFPPAPIVNDEGGPVTITGQLTYSNAGFFTGGIAQPLILLEDQAGFVDRNLYYIFPPESQVLGQFTSDFYESPVKYSLSLPQVPNGSPRDVDNDAEDDPGVQIFAVAYWSNAFGDPYLEERDMQGGGWSGAYASTHISEDSEFLAEIDGGKYVVYAPDDQQGFPSDFGVDGRLFTGDETIVGLPEGYTVVDLDTTPFTFSREREPVIELFEPESAALADYSDLPYVEAFDALIEKMRFEYAFTEAKNIDWNALSDEFRPQFEAAENDEEFSAIFRDFVLSIPDGHLNAPFSEDELIGNYAGGIGLAFIELDDGRIMAHSVLADSSADEAGVRRGAEIIAINGVPIREHVDSTVSYMGPFGTDHARRLSQVAFASHFPPFSDVELTYRNPGEDEQTAELEAIIEIDTLLDALGVGGLDGTELPVEYDILPSGYGIVHIYSLDDNELLTIQLWERMIATFRDYEVPGVIVDMRQNSGGSSFLTTQMAAYFFNEPLVVSRSAVWDSNQEAFISDSRGDSRFYLPQENLRYDGPVAVLVGPNCMSACEFFSYDMTLQDRAQLVGHYPTAGLGGGIQSGSQVQLPGDVFFQFPVVRPLDMDGNIIIEGMGVQPDVLVPVTEETIFGSDDAVLDAAIELLKEAL